MRQTGYYRDPTIYKDHVIFVCEDDLWSIPTDGGTAVRLTANLGPIRHPYLSPDGKHVAFTAQEEGKPEVYLMSAEGGAETRLSYLGGTSTVQGWSRDGKSIFFKSNATQPFRRSFNLHQVSLQGGLSQKLPYGAASQIAQGKEKGTILGRHTDDPARWKRYRGGTAGVFWSDPSDSGEFQQLSNLKGNLTCPMWVGDRVYFLSDENGIGNLYSCTPQGEDLQLHTNHQEYYARNASTDGKRIVYHAGGELYLFDPQLQKAESIEVNFKSPQVQKHRKFVSAGQYLDHYALHPEGHSTIITTRGKSFTFGNWEGAVQEIQKRPGGRYRLTQWLQDQKHWVTICDQSGKEILEIHDSDREKEIIQLEQLDIGRVEQLKVSPTTNQILLSNHRCELFWIDIDTQESKLLDRNEHQHIDNFSWSPDGKWVVYAASESHRTKSIQLCNLETGKIHPLTSSEFSDFSPCFDFEGKFIYFLSYREFNPVYDQHYFDLGFPKGSKPFLISLQKNTPSPFIPQIKPLKASKSGDPSNKKSSEESKEESKPRPTLQIDLEGIQQRVIPFPLPEGIYTQIEALEGKVLFTSLPPEGTLNSGPSIIGRATLEMYDFEKQKKETVATKVSGFKVSLKNETILYCSGNRLRVTLPKVVDEKKQNSEKSDRENGWLNLNRIKLSIDPTQEWKQMYREIWRLQQEQFWVEDMSGVDWEEIYQRYLPLLEKVGCRSEFSDLIWEVQGELGTSHSYEIGGDYRKSPNYSQGLLGADFQYSPKEGAYQIKHIVRGDSWKEGKDSPLNQIGCDVQEGEFLFSVNGERLHETLRPHELLINQANSYLALTLGETWERRRIITVKALPSEESSRYREWVETNRQKVKEATQGRVGYVHIPDMMGDGFAEFHRYFLGESQKDALIVDVRYNSGGHVSSLLLEKLARKRLGYDVTRWGKPFSYPEDAPLGPIVALTNEESGSDGDIFSHCFKLMNLGELIGKRTWGGVIGINPRHSLVDKTQTTQPEYSFWFKDVGWGVENYGTDPDIEVDITPQDWAKGIDPQMNKAIEVILEKMEKDPPKIPEFGPHPSLALPFQEKEKRK